jgi:predicted dehydrogenase
MKKLRVGVMGVGYLGQHHVRLYSVLCDVILVGVPDSDLVRTPVHSPNKVTEEPLKFELQSFLNRIYSGTPPLISGWDGLASLDLANRVVNGIDAFTQQPEASGQSRAMSR